MINEVESNPMSNQPDERRDRWSAVNPATGLRESWDSFYDIPHVQQKSLNSLTLRANTTTVQTVPISDGLSIDFFAKLNHADELIVTFPGAVPAAKKLYPMFWRVSTFRKSDPAILCFADPTILLDPNREIRLGWFLGGPNFDPAPLALQIVREAMVRTGASHVTFVGGSGGGLPALRLSSMMPGSMAYLHEGATNVERSTPTSVGRYFTTVWPNWRPDQLIKAFPERFNMVQHYQRFNPGNFVFFAQSEDDLRFRRDHYTPFKNAFGISDNVGSTADGSRHFHLYKGEVAGHGKVTMTEFKESFTKARGLWRKWRQGMNEENNQTESVHDPHRSATAESADRYVKVARRVSSEATNAAPGYGNPMNFIGHTRFSLYLPKGGGLQLAAQARDSALTTKEYLSALYSEKRMAPRLHSFVRHSLPTLDKAQQGHNVRHVVSYSQEMPIAYKQVLFEAAEKYSWLVLDEWSPETRATRAFERADPATKALLDSQGYTGVYGQYRLDDDDILPVDYFSRMSRYVTDANFGMYVSLGRGVMALQDGESYRHPRVVTKRMIAIGLLSVCHYGQGGVISRPEPFSSHARADHAAPTIVDSRELGFFWNHSITQDSASNGLSERVARDAIYSAFEKHSPVDDISLIVSKFPTLDGKIFE